MPQKTHLGQETIPGLGSILAELGKELKDKWEESDKDVEKCPDELLPPLVELTRKVADLCQIRRKDFNIVRVKNTSFYFPLSAGSIDLVPIRALDGTPKVEEQRFEAGETTYITKGVNISPAVEFLWLR